jgi:gamma-glutamyltranspeptidase/glutathione hydrolase
MKLRSVRAGRGMVAAGHPLAAAEGLSALRTGGNAIDAAIAAAAVLAVVSPHECGLGGDLFAVIHDVKSGKTHALNASGCSPAAATLERYAGSMPQSGPLSISVPGMVGGWEAAVRRFGSMPLGALLGGAIELAEQGFPAYDVMIENAAQRRALIQADRACAALFANLREGERLRQPGAASTLRAIASGGARAFYSGPIAESIAAHVQATGGILAAADLASFEPLWQPVIEAPFRGYRVCTVPPNSWAAAALLQLLAMEREGIATGEQFFLQGIRTRRLAYRLLDGCVADPQVAGDRAQYALERFIAGTPATSAAADGASSHQGTDTSNVVAVDGHGNAVSLLQSVFSPFGSGVYAEQAGALLNNRMRGFSLRAGDPNCLAPRKRPAQTLSPTMVLRDRKVHLACATPGGPGQTGTIAQFLTRVLAWGEPLSDAIAAPRWSMTAAGDFTLEDSAPEVLKRAVLSAEPAVKIERWGAINFGSLAAVQREGDGWVGCVDARRNAAVHGY